MKKILAVLAVIFVICAASAAFAAEPIKIGYEVFHLDSIIQQIINGL